MNIVSEFVQRRSWVTGLLALLLGPVAGMLYLGRGRLASVYLGLSVAVVCLPLLAAHGELLPLAAEPVIGGLWLLYRLGGMFHCHHLAETPAGQYPAAWFARWYVVAVVGLFLPVAAPLLPWVPFEMPARSMEPSLLRGDYLFASSYAYRLGGRPERGDLVVFSLPGRHGQVWVKRLVGLPGDSIQMKGGVLQINGRPVALEPLPASGDGQSSATEYRETLPNGRSYLIREDSDREPLDDTQVYEVPADNYFVLGDNRDRSRDSRTPDHIGFVPDENLIGKVAVVLWNSQRQKLLFLESD